MRKLNKKKIVWILRWKQQGKSTKDLAVSQRVSARRIQQLLKLYREKGLIILKRSGRKRRIVELGHIKLILQEYPRNSGAVILEKKILAKHKTRIPHNIIHMVLKKAGYAKPDPRKQKKRKWIRFEREHSLSLVQIDWHECKVVPGKQLITFLDDASRKVLAAGEYDNATTENSVKTLNEAVNEAVEYGGIEAILSGHDTQFQEEFNKALEQNGIKHIYARVNHPQTVGKLERFHQTYEKHRRKFRTLKEFVDWYNEERMHMSLNMRHAETPSQAFVRKMEPAVWFKKWESWFDW